MKDLRTYLEQLRDNQEELLVTKKPISPFLELTRTIYKLEVVKKRPAVFFENIQGSCIPVITNLFSTRMKLALALDSREEDLHHTYRVKEKNLLQPIVVSNAPIQQIVYTAAEVNLTKLPLVTHNGGDIGPYITGGMMTVKDPDTGIRNSGIYRHMLIDENKLAIHLSETSHAYYIYRKNCDRGVKTPFAITIGAHPAVYLGSLSFQGIDIDEYEVMGGLLGEPLAITRCISSDLEVPAYGEICLEGYIDVAERVKEGPFGEFATLYGNTLHNPVLHVQTITMRKEPIFLDICSGGVEHQLLGGLPRLGKIYDQVKVACPGVKDIYMPPSGFCRSSCYISIKKYVEGEPANASAAAFGADPFIRHVVVVDDDVDIFNEGQVLTAINLNMRMENCFVMGRAKGSPIDPTQRQGLVTKLAIDATRSLTEPMERIDYNDGLDEVNLDQLELKAY